HQAQSHNMSDESSFNNSDSDDLSVNVAGSEEPILRNIADIETRWNSKYHSWKQLLKLHRAIEWLVATLPLSDNLDDRADGQKLKKLALLSHEWNLLSQIVTLIELFDDATTYFSSSKYAILSIIYPLIQALKYTFADTEITDDILYEEDTPNFHHEESSDDDSDELDLEISEATTNCRQKHSTTIVSTNLANNSLQNAQVIKTMQNIIYNSLFDYWNEPVMTAKIELTHQFEVLIASNLEQTIASMHTTSKNNNIHCSHLHLSIFGTSANNTTSGPLDE
ncbi:18584_t:CDS:2, partial [Racocetra fulgida]